MKQQLIFKINQAIQFVLLAFIKLIIIIQNEIKGLLKREEVQTALLVVVAMLMVAIYATTFNIAPSASSGGGGG